MLRVAFAYNWDNKSLYKILMSERVPKSISKFHHMHINIILKIIDFLEILVYL